MEARIEAVLGTMRLSLRSRGVRAVADAILTDPKMPRAVTTLLTAWPSVEQAALYANPYNDSQTTSVSLRTESKDIMIRTPKWSS